MRQYFLAQCYYCHLAIGIFQILLEINFPDIYLFVLDRFWSYCNPHLARDVITEWFSITLKVKTYSMHNQNIFKSTVFQQILKEFFFFLFLIIINSGIVIYSIRTQFLNSYVCTLTEWTLHFAENTTSYLQLSERFNDEWMSQNFFVR